MSEDIVKPRVGLITKDDARRHALKKVFPSELALLKSKGREFNFG